MVPKSKINKVRTVLQKELLLCTLLGGQRTFGMHSFPLCIRASHLRNHREYQVQILQYCKPLVQTQTALLLSQHHWK